MKLRQTKLNVSMTDKYFLSSKSA